MPQLNRRRFLQMAGAAGLAPAIPALPAAAPRGATTAQMLWASLYAKAGNAQTANGLASAMGISSEAAQGVYARLVQTQVLTAHSAGLLRHTARPLPTAVPTTPTTNAVKSRSIRVDVKKLLTEDAAEIDETPIEVEITESVDQETPE